MAARVRSFLAVGVLVSASALLTAQTGQFPPGQYPLGQYPPGQYPPAYPGGRAPGGINIPPINWPKKKPKPEGDEKNQETAKREKLSIGGRLRSLGEKDLILE